MSVFLGIDTSNYTTSAAIVKNGSVDKNCRSPLDVREGERGLRQSDALFQHTKNLPSVMGEIGERKDISAIGVSARPRDVEGSYMPCFLAGVAAARSLSSILGVPCYEFSHQAGHIAAALYSCGREDLSDKRFIAFHVSGGTTELLLVDNMTVTRIGGTLDISAGQLVDRAGVLLGLKFPCGKELERISAPLESVSCISHVRGLECNLSGVENAVIRMLENGDDRSQVAAFTLKCVLRALDKLTENAIKEHGALPVIYAGGVMSNMLIRKQLSEKYDSYFAAPEFSCDNAAGVALLTERRYNENK